MVEVALAILVLSVGLLGVFALFPVGINSSRAAVDDTRMAMLAQSILSEMRNSMATNYNDGGTGFTYKYEIPGFPVTRTQLIVSGGTGSAEFKDQRGFPICACELRVVAENSGRQAHVNLTVWAGDLARRNSKTREIEFYTRMARMDAVQ